MTKTTIKKGFLIEIPLSIRKRVEFEEGDQVLIETLNGKTILLEKPFVKDPFSDCEGMWKDRKEMKNSVNYVSKSRKESERF